MPHFIYNCEIFSQTGNQHKDKAVIYCACALCVAHIARAMPAIYVCFLCVFILQTYIDAVKCSQFVKMIDFLKG